MIKIKKYIFVLFLMLLSFYINSSVVHADSNGFIGTAEPGGGCSGNYCYTNEVGVRITIVDKSGNRCYYDAPKNKIFCGPDVTFYDNRPHDQLEQDNVNNKFSLSIDYWFTDNSLLLYPNECWQYGYKYTKSEFVQSAILRNFGLVGQCSIYQNWGDATDYNVKWLFFGDQEKSHIDIKTDNGSWKVFTKKGKYKTKQQAVADHDELQLETFRNPSNINNIIDYLECINLHDDSNKFGVYDSTGKPVKLLPSECTTIRSPEQKQNNIDIYNRIFRNAFKNRSFDVRKVELINNSNNKPEYNKIYIQFEEVVAFSQYDKSLAPSTFKGTVSEVSYLYSYFKGKNGNNVPGTTRWSLIGTAATIGNVKDSSTMAETNEKIKDLGNNATSAICTNIFDGWANYTTDGVFSYGVKTEEKDLLISRKNTSKVYCKGSNLIIKSGYNFKDWLYNRYGGVDTRNIASFWVNPTAFGDCNTDARSIISTEAYKKSTNWKSILYNSSSNIRNKCFDSTGAFKDVECYQLNPDYIKYAGNVAKKRTDGTTIDVCAPLNCQDTLKYYSNVNESAYIKQGVSSTKYVENITSINSLQTNYDKSIYYLYTTTDKGFNFSEFTKLQYYNYRGMFNRPAECSVVPTAPISVESSCDSSGVVTFSDSSYCSSGIAYSDSTGNRQQTSFDSNFDIKQEVQKPVYNSDTGEIELNDDGTLKTEWVEETKSGYCEEKVQFKFPQYAGTVKAGQVIKWGIDTSVENNKFGTMYLERKCTFPAKDPGARNPQIINNTIDLNKINGLTPDVRINYAEALGFGVNRLERKLNNIGYDFMDDDSVKLDFKQTTLSAGSSELTPGTSSYTCSGCVPGSTVTMTTEYDITYPDRLKWYFDKASEDNNKLKNLEEIEDDVDTNLNYVFMGYGIPTSFATPTNVYSKDNFTEESADSYNNAYSYGYDINLESTKGALFLGLKNIGSKSSGSYHFDKQIGYGGDSYSFRGGYMVYSCGFSIKNDLFDTESADNKCIEKMNCTTPKGIDVVFRTVELVNSESELNNAFPGRTGNGRSNNRGKNWKILSDEKVAKILSTIVYDGEPMYHIELTPGKIKKIRQDNNTMRKKYDPYTYMGYYKETDLTGYDTYDFQEYDEDATVAPDLSLIELKDKYLYTTSKYLTDLTDDDYGLTGTCMVTNRLERHANTQGCYPWGMINALSHD